MLGTLQCVSAAYLNVTVDALPKTFFAKTWNAVVQSIRAADHLSNAEMHTLLFGIDGEKVVEAPDVLKAMRGLKSEEAYRQLRRFLVTSTSEMPLAPPIVDMQTFATLVRRAHNPHCLSLVVRCRVCRRLTPGSFNPPHKCRRHCIKRPSSSRRVSSRRWMPTVTRCSASFSRRLHTNGTTFARGLVSLPTCG